MQIWWGGGLDVPLVWGGLRARSLPLAPAATQEAVKTPRG